MDFEKSMKNAKWFAVGLLILEIIVFIIQFTRGTTTTLMVLLRASQIIITIATIVGCQKQKAMDQFVEL